MKNILLISIAILYINCLQSQTVDYAQVNSHTFETRIAEHPGTVLDVRTSSEFKNGHLKNAGQLNVYALDFKQKLLLLPQNKPIYLYCNTGYRSEKAAKFLIKNNYTKVYNLEHGIMEWDQENKTIVVEPDAKPDQENKMQFDEFNALIQNNFLVFVDYYAPWCGPCRKMMPIVDRIKKDYSGRMIVVKINADASKKLIKEQKIASVPYLVLYKNASLAFEYKGYVDQEKLLRELKTHIP